ncbi:hypothetical protein [Mesorhizobium sp. M0870]|uniref:hypothetical protein n=1 Tax=unclassified Mesorhizobium TaxID=325217 RepID=UPI0033373D4D
MEQFLGLDVSVLTTSVCVMETAGKVIREGKVETELEAIGALFAIGGLYKRVGLEAGPFSQMALQCAADEMCRPARRLLVERP